MPSLGTVPEGAVASRRTLFRVGCGMKNPDAICSRRDLFRVGLFRSYGLRDAPRFPTPAPVGLR